MKSLFFIPLFLLTYFPLFSEEVKTIFVIGDVKYSINNDIFVLKTGDIVPENAVIQTGDRSVAIIGTNDFNIKLSSNTKVSVASILPNTRFDFSNGKIWVKVNRVSSGHTFLVKTPTSNAGVRGTEFIYDIQDEMHRIYVLEGSVFFGNKDIEKIVKTGQMGELKGSSMEIKEFNKEQIVLAKSGLPSIVRTKDIKSYFEKEGIRKNIYREIGLLNRDKMFIGENRKTDLITGRVVTDENGNTIRVMQSLKKLSDNTLQILNITKRSDGFINVVEYKSIYKDKIPTNVNDIVNISSNESMELMKIVNIIQIDGIYTTRMKIIDDKSNPISKILKMGVSNSLAEPIVSNVGDYTKLKQVNEIDPYLSATYTIGASNLVLKVYILKEDGTIVPVYKDMELSSDFLMTMSFKFIFDDNTQVGGLITNPKGISFHVLPDIGFVLINELVK